MKRALGILFVWACGGGDGSQLSGPGDRPPFGGRDIQFHGQYVLFPSDHEVDIVRDTAFHTADQACSLLAQYKRVPLPARAEHYALVLVIQSAQGGDQVTIDINDRGGAGDMRYAGLGQYPAGATQVPPGAFGVDAGGLLTLRELTQYVHVSGDYSLVFRSGEKLSGSFDLPACPR